MNECEWTCLRNKYANHHRTCAYAITGGSWWCGLVLNSSAHREWQTSSIAGGRGRHSLVLRWRARGYILTNPIGGVGWSGKLVLRRCTCCHVGADTAR